MEEGKTKTACSPGDVIIHRKELGDANITEGQPKNRASSFDNRTSIYGERLVLSSTLRAQTEGSEVEGSRTIRASLPINETKQFTRETII
jgi:hypothetical protein